MRLPFPEYIPFRYASYFAILLCVAQVLEGTPIEFSICCFFFILIATLAFNLAGGLSHPSGSYVFFYAVLAVIVGLFWKAVIGEPANSNLSQPLLTIEAHLGGITAMLVAVFISQKFTWKRTFLGGLLPDAKMLHASLGCLVVGVALSVTLLVVPYEGGSILSALAQLNHFLEISIILGVIYQIRRSGGNSSINLPVIFAGCASFAFGILSFSKQGMFTPPVCWILAAASQRYRVSLFQVMGLILGAFLTFYYLVPYSQYGRNYRSEFISENIDISISLLSDLGEVRRQYFLATTERNEDAPAYFDTDQGLFDRLQMLSMDDAIINVTELNGRIGFLPLLIDFENLIPHFLSPDKPTINFGNLYAHEIGMVGAEDTTTGVSFSPIGEAFHLGRWLGIFVVAPILWIALFVVYDSLCGDVRKDPWGLLAVVLFAHIAPEALLGGVIYLLWYGAIGIIFVALTASYLMPVLGGFFAGRESIDLRRVGRVRSIPRRLPSISPIRASRSPTGSPPAV